MKKGREMVKSKSEGCNTFPFFVERKLTETSFYIKSEKEKKMKDTRKPIFSPPLVFYCRRRVLCIVAFRLFR